MRTLKSSRTTVALVIDHIQPNFGLASIDVHLLEEDAQGARATGLSLDRVTREELGLPAEGSWLLDGVTPAVLIAFVVSLSDGVPVTIDAPPED